MFNKRAPEVLATLGNLLEFAEAVASIEPAEMARRCSLDTAAQLQDRILRFEDLLAQPEDIIAAFQEFGFPTREAALKAIAQFASGQARREVTAAQQLRSVQPQAFTTPFRPAEEVELNLAAGELHAKNYQMLIRLAPKFKELLKIASIALINRIAADHPEHADPNTCKMQ